MSYCPNIYTVSKLQKNARKTVKYSTCSAEKGFYEGKVSYHFLPPVLEVKFLPAYYFSSLFWENTLWYTTAFSSNSSSLRPVFSTNTELSSTSLQNLCLQLNFPLPQNFGKTDFWYNAELFHGSPLRLG